NENENPEQLISDTELLQQQGWGLDVERMGIFNTLHSNSYFKTVCSLYEFRGLRKLDQEASSYDDCGNYFPIIFEIKARSAIS
ncbi:uncharacterized protein N7482_007991, partial [Penicillium canariense]